MEDIVAHQIDGAIDLLVRYDNLVASYLLGATAINNIWTTAKKEGRSLPLDLMRYARNKNPKAEDDLRRVFFRVYNELKHIGKVDFESYIHPRSAEAHILTATLSYQQFFGDTTERMTIFLNWMAHVHPDLQGPDFTRIKDFDEVAKATDRHERVAPAKRLLEAFDANPSVMKEARELHKAIGSWQFKNTF